MDEAGLDGCGGEPQDPTSGIGGQTLAKKTYDLNFKGYRREVNWKGLPAISGVYCVYACRYNAKTKKVSIRQLLYIGESRNVRERVPEEPKKRRDVWAKLLREGEELCVSRAKVGSANRVRVEAALINFHKPPCNDEYVDSFPFDETTVTTNGDTAELSREFTVYRDD